MLKFQQINIYLHRIKNVVVIEYVISTQNYFTFLAQEVRELLAEVGLTKMDDVIGRADLLEIAMPKNHWKASKIDIKPLIHVPKEAESFERRFVSTKRDLPGKVLDIKLIEKSLSALEHKKKVKLFECFNQKTVCVHLQILTSRFSIDSFVIIDIYDNFSIMII